MTETPGQSLFFDSPADAARELSASISSGAAAREIRSALGTMPGAAKDAVLAEVGEVAAGVMEMDVTDVFAAAWDRLSGLREAGAATRADPDTEQVVALVAHTFTFTHEPSVEVHVADLPVAEVVVRVEMQAEVRGALAVVKGGRLTAIRTGAADVTGSVSLAGREVVRRQVTLDLASTVRLGNGVPL